MTFSEDERKKIQKESLKEFYREEYDNFKIRLGGWVINLILIAIFMFMMKWFFMTDGGHKVMTQIQSATGR